jgi:hypothetical protein
MMAEIPSTIAESPRTENIEDLSPYALLRNFSKSRVLPATLLAVAIHVVAIGGLSTRYIYRTWIDPTADAQPPAPAMADGAAEGGADEVPGAEPSGDSSSDTADASAAPAAGPTDASSDDTATPPVIERVTEAADPDTIPDEPGGLGISIDDIKE